MSGSVTWGLAELIADPVLKAETKLQELQTRGFPRRERMQPARVEIDPTALGLKRDLTPCDSGDKVEEARSICNAAHGCAAGVRDV
eukprot:2451648-Amphidinium_carterae.3